MRVSADPDDPGFNPKQKLGPANKVWLDGVLCTRVMTADDEQGFVEVLDSNEHGNAYIKDGKPAICRKHGVVKIEIGE